MTKLNFPFSAVTGNQPFKLALTLSAINPAIGGVLVSGPRGAAKSTLARAIVDLLPCESNLINLPLGTSEEMLSGSLDLQQVLNQQQVKFNPGLLAKADQGVLYVDEVNLLADPLVDLLLDVCASGINYVERDGISHQHQSRFILLGTMNPDEGQLRAQLIDRFGLCVDLDEKLKINKQIEIVQLRENFDRDPQAFIDSYQAQQTALQQQIDVAKKLIATVVVSLECRTLIATRCQQANVDGLRADIVWLKAAIAHAAWCGKAQVSASDIDAVAELVLSHRRKESSQNSSSNTSPDTPPNVPPPPNKPPFSRPPSVAPPSFEPPSSPETKSDSNTDSTSGTSNNSNDGDWGAMSPQQQQTSKIAEVLLAKTAAVTKAITKPVATEIASNNKLGQIVGGQKKSAQRQTSPVSKSIDWFNTLANSLGQWPLPKLYFKSAKVGQPIVHLVLLDTSGSTLSSQQFGNAKAVVKQIAEQAYQQRQQLAIFGFGNQQVQQILSLQKAPKQLDSLLASLSAGGGTPLIEALSTVSDYQRQQLLANPSISFRNYLITDGRVSQQVNQMKLQGQTTVLDVEVGAVKYGRAQEIAQQLNGDYLPLPA